jgi:pimeloyl-ACP methyl ester carboxylesterase
MKVSKGYVDTTDGQIHYRSYGRDDGVPLVFLHMIASSSQCYEQIMSMLGDEYRMVAVDTPGFGESFSPPLLPTITYYASTLLEALAELSISAFNAFGHHTGAAVAAEMAAIAPERITSLMMKGPLWLTDEEARSFHEQFGNPIPIEPDGSHLMRIWDHVAGLDPDHPLALCHREAIDTLKALSGFHEAFAAVFSQDYQGVFSKVTCPMLLLCGENDLLLPYFKRVCDAFPEAKASVLPGCGVYGLDNCAERIAGEIKGFLQVMENGAS